MTQLGVATILLVGFWLGMQAGRFWGRRQVADREAELAQAIGALSGGVPEQYYQVHQVYDRCPVCGDVNLENIRICLPNDRAPGCRYPLGSHLHAWCSKCKNEWIVPIENGKKKC